MEPTLLGTGVLTWAKAERISDRYGAVYLMEEGGNSRDGGDPKPYQAEVPADTFGALMVKVTEARESTHVGDMFRGIFPSTPEVGGWITLGIGFLFYTTCDDARPVGLKPEDGRVSDWLDPHALYRAHEQSVELWFQPLPVPEGATPPEVDLQEAERVADAAEGALLRGIREGAEQRKTERPLTKTTPSGVTLYYVPAMDRYVAIPED
jgi:hypothetical protein